MIEFVTLFLGGVIAGSAGVQLMVDREVATVEIRLDAEAVATLRGAPWEVEVDFGEEPAPHLLEAIAFAADGSELDRARQWINLAPQQAEVSILLDHDRGADGVEARLSWHSVTEESEPLGVSAFFDDLPLEVENPRVIPLPSYDPERLHHLRVELEFSGSLRSVVEIAFGGGLGEEVDTELTAYPVSLAERSDLPPIDAMQTWFHARGERLPVHAVEKGLAEIVVVRDQAAQRILERLMTWRSRKPRLPILAKDHRLRFVGAGPALLRREDSPLVVFPRSPEVRDRSRGLMHTLGSVQLPDSTDEQRLADAVAVAGLFAHQSGRRRAVVVITTSDPTDASQFKPEQVRRYLRGLGVPLFVWNPQRGASEAGGWGAAVNISSDGRLSRAYQQLTRVLDRQRIVWLNGLHLPQTIALSPEVEGVEAAR